MFIKPNSWTRLKGYPVIDGGDSSGITFVDKYKATYDLLQLFTDKPADKSFYDENSTISEIAELRLRKYRIERVGNGEKCYITLTYQPGTASTTPEDGEDEYFLESSVLEKPLEKAPNYRVKWNYDLYQYNPSSLPPSVPSWWTDDITRSHASGKEVQDEYLWSQDNPGGLWQKIADRTKPGQDTYPVPSTIIQEKKYYRSKSSASEAAATILSYVTPDEDYGKTEGEWLVWNVSLQKSGRRYLNERQLINADSWDSDLYGDS